MKLRNKLISNPLKWAPLFSAVLAGIGMTPAFGDVLTPEWFNILTESPQLNWSYSGTNGPNFWGSMDGAQQCTTGLSQSPIAIETGSAAGISDINPDSHLRSLQINWKPSGLSVLSNGHTVEAIYDSGSTIHWNGLDYTLQQFHLHSPSEHLVNERQYPMEAHFVSYNQQPSGMKILVLAVMLKAGDRNDTLQTLLDHTSTAVSPVPQPISGVSVDANLLLPKERNYFAYLGSLTTPPCSEGVQWIILKEPLEVSVPQVRQFQKLLHGPNNRPIESLNERTVKASLFCN